MRPFPVRMRGRRCRYSRAMRLTGISFLVAAAFFAPSCGSSPWPGPEATREALIALHGEVRGRVLAGDFARANGFAYAVDVGELLKVAARLEDREMYAALRDFAVRRLIVDDPDDPYTRGFVLWRRSPVPVDSEDAPDASGTTEALRVSEGLWEGAHVSAPARTANWRSGSSTATGGTRAMPPACSSSATTSTSAAGTSPRIRSWWTTPRLPGARCPGHRAAGSRGTGGAELRGRPRRALAGGTGL